MKYIPVGIKGELERSGVGSNQRGQIFKTFIGGSVTIHSSGQTISNLSYIEGIILGAGEEVFELLEE
jgi:hypothetical protein